MKLTHVIMEADKRQNLQDGQRAGDPGKETAWLQEEGPEAPDPRKSLFHLGLGASQRKDGHQTPSLRRALCSRLFLSW